MGDASHHIGDAAKAYANGKADGVREERLRERMSTRAWWMRVGEVTFWIDVARDGTASVVVTDGELATLGAPRPTSERVPPPPGRAPRRGSQVR